MKVKKVLSYGLLVSLFLLTKTSLLAQSAGNYVFTKTMGVYQPLVAAPDVFTNQDESITASLPIGFTFNYAGIDYTTFKISSNGFINLGGNMTSATFSNNLASTTAVPVIAPLWDDLTSSAAYEISGTPGNQILTVEWRNVKWIYDASTPGYSFQVKLYEADGKIEFIYGDSTAPGTTSKTASIGINSTPGGAGNFLSVNALGTGASNSAANNSINIWPGLNTVYVFEKPAVGPPVADFIASNTTPGAGDNVTLIDQSIANPSITSWEWTITPNTFVYVTGNQNSQSPVVAFQLGTYTVKLKVTNPMGSDSITKVNYITVSGYCSSGATSTADTDIGYFTFDTFSNGTGPTPVTNNPNANGTYSDFTNLGPIQANINGAYPVSVSHITSGATFYNAYIKIFIDYNQNGFFEVPDEVALEGPTTSASPTLSGIITIPHTALTGLTRLRIVQREGGNTTTTTPCGTFSYGETEDYTIEILPPLPCTNPPVAGTASANPSTVYPNEPVYLDLTGYNGSVQWQYSTDGINFSNILGATSVPDTLYANNLGTFYVRAWVVTSNCSPDSSNIVTINVVPRPGDTPSNPKLITTNFYTDTDSTYGYTNQYTGPNNQPSRDIFYQYIVPTCIDSININTCLTAFDSYIHVLINGNHVDSDDDGCGGGFGVGSKIVLDNTQFNAGDTLLIVVEGWSNTQGTYTLSFNAYSAAPDAPLASNDTVCTGNSTTLTATGTGTLLWYDVPTGGTPIATGNTFTTPILTSDTNYFVEAVAGPCTSTRTLVRVYVFGIPNPPSVMNDTVCVGDTAVLTAMSNVNVVWYDTIGGNIVGTGYTFVTPPLANDVTYYAVAVSGGCESTPVAVHAIVNTPGSITVNVPDTVQVGQPFQVSASGGLTYLWSFGPVASPDTAYGPGPHTVTMNLPGVYFITLKYTVECGAGLDSIVIPIVVEQTTKLADNAFQSVVVYPNPNKGSFQLQATLTQNSPVTFEIYNNLGQVIYQNQYKDIQFIKENYELNLVSGIYSYRLISKQGTYVGKLVIE